MQIVESSEGEGVHGIEGGEFNVWLQSELGRSFESSLPEAARCNTNLTVLRCNLFTCYACVAAPTHNYLFPSLSLSLAYHLIIYSADVV